MSTISQYIDHTALSADTTEEKIKSLCLEAEKFQFWSVCINPAYIPLAKKMLANSDVKICTVVGFPLGATLSKVKVFEAISAIEMGADEIDMVVNIGWVKSGKWNAVREDIQCVFDACVTTPLKVIFETCLLNEQEIENLGKICSDIGVAFIKTSTGFSHSGATINAVKLMKQSVGNSVQIKASGGIKTKEVAEQMLLAGATRLGTSSGVMIITGESNTTGQY
ncbi:deoxyribose-phosphate aldolase [Ursidibacter maritimus]|uniref:Deoxyribose-phosphate aldolase n=1 Tax=Ursidibacter maritimus TaxID=1331689 RepID=A0A949WKI0_9PAST|nr:deoxyribose-phosphate aldolase [Ursidibacter maritimus]KAE9541481.1 2-deoxyribose-5-phosphate aldolase [Ursidibacter maritimus]MBV6524837.1 deoxyribose-phosphate aldolase [Ursidibacter maritimus]MBV6526744.1 deoxyribose-phosphate aldolase [Ursidibacter maritimus]MBV6528595.1 deoxyribose-phosphate aldolase [Ursidibacter maritimus]MBV6530442.1 deoxyribose-phosphate aldolase [Ursidibacter maritimus]